MATLVSLFSPVVSLCLTTRKKSADWFNSMPNAGCFDDKIAHILFKLVLSSTLDAIDRYKKTTHFDSSRCFLLMRIDGEKIIFGCIFFIFKFLGCPVGGGTGKRRLVLGQCGGRNVMILK